MESKLVHWSHLFLLVLLVSLHRCSRAQSTSSSALPLGLDIKDSFKNTSLSVMLTTFLLSFIFIAFFLLLCHHCVNTYVRTRNQIAAELVRRQVVDKCPILIYSDVKELRIGNTALECAVCLSEFQDTDKIRLLTTCLHVFHPDCIDRWFASRLTCPVCRAELTPTDCDDIAVVDVPTASNPDESPAADGEVEQQSTAESPKPPAEATHVDDESETTGLQKQTTPPIRSKMTERFARSHSTGHSLFMEREGMMERYTLRLPDHVREEILGNHRTIRRCTIRNDVVLRGEWSSKRGSDHVEGWVVFSMTPPFVSRDWSSVKFLKQNAESSWRRPPV